MHLGLSHAHRLWWRVSSMLAALTLASVASAADLQLPVINAHSQLAFAVYKGDIVTVAVEAEGEGIEAKWVRSQDTFCRALVCEIDTSGWSLGTHKVVFVVFNSKGSLFLRYQLKVLASPAGRKPSRVQPELITAQTASSIETVADADMVVRTMAGRGYSYHRRKVLVVGPTPRSLEWAEKLRTQASSSMQFGRNGSEWHAIGPQSSVYLVTAEAGRRVIVLKKGTLRSRQLGVASPSWSILTDDGLLQVDGDAYADVLVTRNQDDQVVVAVLRGHARVVMRAKDENNPGDGATSTLLAHGSEATFTPGDTAAPQVVLPRAKRVGKLVALTTPEYLPGRMIAKEQPGASLLGGKLPKKLADAVTLALDANARADYFVAIEALQLFEAAVIKQADASLAYGTALRGVFMYDAAAKYLDAAATLDEENPSAPFQLGLMYLADGANAKAIEQFQRADDRDYPAAQQLDYYLGVAEYRQKSPVAAKSHFTYALWQPDEELITASARDYERRLHADGWLDLRFGLKMLYDTNVLHVSDDGLAALTAVGAVGIDKNKSAGYLGSAGFSVWPYRTERSYFTLGFDISQSGWTEASLKALGVMDQALTVGFGLQLGGESGAPALFGVDLTGILATTAVGKERSNDQVGSVIKVGSPALWQLYVGVDSRLNSDPLPNRLDLYDPVMEEAVAPTDRSNRRIAYGLGMKPMSGGGIDIGFDVWSGTTDFAGEFRGEENYQELAIDLAGGYAASTRQRLGLELGQLARSFKDASDGRQDTRTSIGLDWLYYYTTSLSHLIEVSMAQHKSTRDINSYNRQVFSYGLNLNF